MCCTGRDDAGEEALLAERGRLEGVLREGELIEAEIPEVAALEDRLLRVTHILVRGDDVIGGVERALC
jgi:hypothetical protein